MLQDRVGLFVFLVVAAAAVVLVGCVLLVKRLCVRSRNTRSIGGSWRGNRLERQRQYERDRALAEQMQMQLNEEIQEEEKAQRRKDRRDWYEGYLVPFTMTVTPTDLIYLSPEGDVESPPIIINDSQQQSLPNGQESQVAGDVAEEDHDRHVRLILPKHARRRHVDGHCTICLEEYEMSCEVVWSDLACQHAFHRECLMPWLIKGKKRCPICRHWFVPAAKIEDQKKALIDRTERSMTIDSIEEEEEEDDPEVVREDDLLAHIMESNVSQDDDATKPTDETDSEDPTPSESTAIETIPTDDTTEDDDDDATKQTLEQPSAPSEDMC